MKHQRLIAAVMIAPMLWLGIGWSNHLAAQAAQPKYAIDAEGIRWQKIVGGAQVTTYLVDRNLPFQQVLEERDGAGTVTASYVYLDDVVAAAFAGVGTRFYVYDGQMSTRFLTDGGANVTDSYTFDAWGVTLASAGATPNNYLYTGEQFDPHLGLQYNRARYYANGTGRFMSHDVLLGVEQDPLSLHRYLYGALDPARRTDPSGLITLVELLVVITILSILTLLAIITYFVSPNTKPLSPKGTWRTRPYKKTSFTHGVGFEADFKEIEMPNRHYVVLWILGTVDGNPIAKVAGEYSWVKSDSNTWYPYSVSLGSPYDVIIGRVLTRADNLPPEGGETSRIGVEHLGLNGVTMIELTGVKSANLNIMLVVYPKGYTGLKANASANDPKKGSLDWIQAPYSQ